MKQKLEAVVNEVNERTRILSQRAKLIDLQTRIDSAKAIDFSDRSLMRDSIVQRVIGGKPKERYLVLLTDFVLLLKPTPSPSNGKCHYQIDLMMEIGSFMVGDSCKV